MLPHLAQIQAPDAEPSTRQSRRARARKNPSRDEQEIRAQIEAELQDPLSLQFRIRREKARRSLSEFVRQAWPHVEPDPLLDLDYVDAVCLHLQAVTEGRIPLLMLNIEPRSGKSTILLLWAAWEWIRNPSVKFLVGSYKVDAATEASVKLRRLIHSQWFMERWGATVRPSPEVDGKKAFELLTGGAYKVVSTQQDIQGFGADRLVWDDPIGRSEVNSKTARAQVVVWFHDQFRKRGNKKLRTPTVIAMQRLDPEDPCGQLLYEEGERGRPHPTGSGEGDWDVLVLPTEMEEERPPRPANPAQRNDRGDRGNRSNTILTRSGEWRDRREVGELLSPSRTTREEVLKLKRRVAMWLAQHQQSPVSSLGENRRFQGFDPAKCCRPLPTVAQLLDEGWLFWLGADHGERPGNQVFIIGAYHPERQKALVLREVISRIVMSTAEQGRHLFTVLSEMGIPKRKITRAIGDINSAGAGAAGRSVNDILTEVMDIPWQSADKRPGSVKLRIRATDEGFLSGAVVIDESGCPVLIECLRLWDGAKNDLTHPIDGLTYPLVGLIEEWQAPHATTEIVTGGRRRR